MFCLYYEYIFEAMTHKIIIFMRGIVSIMCSNRDFEPRQNVSEQVSK